MKRSRRSQFRLQKLRRDNKKVCCAYHRGLARTCSDNKQPNELERATTQGTASSALDQQNELQTPPATTHKTLGVSSESSSRESRVGSVQCSQQDSTRLQYAILQDEEMCSSSDDNSSIDMNDTQVHCFELEEDALCDEVNQHFDDGNNDEDGSDDHGSDSDDNDRGQRDDGGGDDDGGDDGDDDNDDDDDDDGDGGGDVSDDDSEEENVVDNFNAGERDPDDPHDSDDSSSNDSGGSDVQTNFSFDHQAFNVICRTVINCTVREVVAVLLAVGSKHRLTYDAIIGMMRCFNALYGRQYLPLDKKTFWKLLGRNEIGITKYVYCSICLRGHGRRRAMANVLECPCGQIIRKKVAKCYIDLNIGNQMKNLLLKPEVRNAVRYRDQRQIRFPGTMEDILDGREYLQLRQDGNVLNSQFNFSYTFNLDGFRLAKSSNAEAWPIYLKWNELPLSLRQKHVLLAGVWADSVQPNMNVFLEPFVNQANTLSNVGFSWTPPEHEEDVRSRFIPTCCVVDAKARCSILNFTTPTGYCGCPFCNHRGLYVGGCVHFPFLPPVPVPERRTDADIRRCMLEAAEGNEEHVLGFHGTSQLMLMDNFNLSKGIVVDDLHPFSGVIKHHTELLLTRTRNNIPPYYIGNSIHRIDSRLARIRTPSNISRKPRSLRHRKKYKSSEWLNWLLYYAVPCLEGILPQPYLRHLQLLAQAIYLVSKEYVSEEDCIDAQNMFRRYVELFERYFGPENMRYNTHILLHVVDCVREWGPMFAQSTSFFESWNNTLLQTVTSPKGRGDQIITRFLMKRFLDNVEDNEDISQNVKREVRTILDQPRLRENVRVGEITLLGKRIQRAPNERERHLLQEYNLDPLRIIVYKRAAIGKVEFRSADYRYDGGETKSDDTHVLTWNDEFAQILTIALLDEEGERVILVFLNILNTNAHVNRYVCRVDAADNVIVLHSFDAIRCHAVFCEIPAAGAFIMPIRNSWELD